MNSIHPEGRKCRAVADWDNPTLTVIESDSKSDLQSYFQRRV